MGTLVVIPARWGSTRFPGKPLALLQGKSLLHRVIDAARSAVGHLRDVEIIVATDDDRVLRHALEAQCTAIMTDPTLDSGTARTLAAAFAQEHPPAAVINLQGDTPFVSREMLVSIVDGLHAGYAVVTPAVQLCWRDLDALRTHKQLSPFSGTTCVCDHTGRALWFSKQVLPTIRDEHRLRATTAVSPVRRHVGLYGYTLDALQRFVAHPSTELERLEGLEQLRFLEIGIPVQVVPVAPPLIDSSGIDTPEDLARAEQLMARHGDPEGQ